MHCAWAWLFSDFPGKDGRARLQLFADYLQVPGGPQVPRTTGPRSVPDLAPMPWIWLVFPRGRVGLELDSQLCRVMCGARPAARLGPARLGLRIWRLRGRHRLSLSRLEKGCFGIACFQLVHSELGFPSWPREA